MKVLDLFSGIGGFSLGLEWAGMSTKAMCEKDPYCRKVLSKHWPDLTIHEDIRDLDGKEYANSIDVVAGGFPCQPFSVAGERKGKLDDRHLWPEMFRVIKESKPRWVIGENVFGFINMALDDVQSDLESEHYEVRKFVLPAVAVDAKHRRDRCFVIAYRREAQSMAYSRCESERFSFNRSGDERIHGEEERQWSEEGDGFTNSSQALAYTNGERQLQQRGTEQEVRGWVGNSGEQDVAHSYNEGIQRSEKPRGHGEIGEESNDQHIERCGGGSVGLSNTERQACWLPEPRVGRVAHGVPNRVDRLKGLGNAVVPQLIQAIGEIVIKADREIYS